MRNGLVQEGTPKRMSLLESAQQSLDLVHEIERIQDRMDSDLSGMGSSLEGNDNPPTNGNLEGCLHELLRRLTVIRGRVQTAADTVCPDNRVQQLEPKPMRKAVR